MFDVNCTFKMFQRVLRTVLQTCNGVENLLDIIVYRKNKEVRDSHLMNVCNTLRENDLTLDKSFNL